MLQLVPDASADALWSRAFKIINAEHGSPPPGRNDRPQALYRA